MPQIQRYESSRRMSRAVVHNGVVYLAGVTASSQVNDIVTQTEDVLQIIEKRLADIGTAKDRILTAQIWLRNIERDFDAMNRVWEAWLPEGCSPARATCETNLALPSLLLEVLVVAAV